MTGAGQATISCRMAWVRQIVAALLALVLIVGTGESVRAEVAMIDGSATTMTMAEDEASNNCGGCSGGDLASAECTAVACPGCGAGSALISLHGEYVSRSLGRCTDAAGRLLSGLNLSPHPTPPKHSVLS